MKIKFLALFATLALASACEVPQDQAGSASGSGNAGYGDGGYNTGSIGNIDPGTLKDFQSNVSDRVFFALDSSTLSAEAQSELKRQAEWLKSYPYVNVVIEGHADERGTREYNLALGERRATAARNYLVSLGVGSGRISTLSYGKERPAVLGSNESAWSQNRRAVTVLAD